MGVASPEIPGDILKAAEDMPAISPIMGKINEISRQMDTSPKEMVKIIMLDPVLTGKVIKLVNSSFYGLPIRVKSLAQAVVLLGMNTVKNLAISTSLFSTIFIKEKISPLHPEEFWRHCLGTAVGCKFLARGLRVPAEILETFFVAGLLHDVGKILFIRTDPDRFNKALTESRRLGVSLSFAELAHFGCSHPQAGGVLAKKWKLEDSLVQVIESHHSPLNGELNSLMELVIVVNNLCKLLLVGESGSNVIEEAADDSAGRLGVTPELFSRTSDQLPSELEKAAEFLNLAEE